MPNARLSGDVVGRYENTHQYGWVVAAVLLIVVISVPAVILTLGYVKMQEAAADIEEVAEGAGRGLEVDAGPLPAPEPEPNEYVPVIPEEPIPNTPPASFGDKSELGDAPAARLDLVPDGEPEKPIRLVVKTVEYHSSRLGVALYGTMEIPLHLREIMHTYRVAATLIPPAGRELTHSQIYRAEQGLPELDFKMSFAAMQHKASLKGYTLKVNVTVMKGTSTGYGTWHESELDFDLSKVSYEAPMPLGGPTKTPTAPIVSDSPYRDWTLKSGTVINGRFLDFKKGRVIMELDNGEEKSIAKAALTEKDWDFIQNELLERNEKR